MFLQGQYLMKSQSLLRSPFSWQLLLQISHPVKPCRQSDHQRAAHSMLGIKTQWDSLCIDLPACLTKCSQQHLSVEVQPTFGVVWSFSCIYYSIAPSLGLSVIKGLED